MMLKSSKGGIFWVLIVINSLFVYNLFRTLFYFIFLMPKTEIFYEEQGDLTPFRVILFIVVQ